MISKILTGSALTLVVTGRAEPFVISRDHKLFDEILAAANARDEVMLLGLIDIANKVNTFSAGKVKIVDGEVYVGNEIVHNLVADRIMELIGMGQDFDFMAKFLENLMLNPSYQSRQELYLFLENGNMPITDDGRFLAFKWVQHNYRDVHSGTFDNSVGKICKMDRQKVDDNRQNTCSAGLHVCTHAYTKFGERLMVVAVNPRDVVSVPYDYDNAKMRVSEYEVLYEVNPSEYTKFQKGFAARA